MLWMALVALIVFGVGVVWFPLPKLQPLSFNHLVHKDLGCVTCHEGVETRAHAGLPTITVCLDCHDTAPMKDPQEVKVWNRAVEKKQIRWNRLRRVADHVYYSHRRHVTLAKIECAACHGNMADRTTPPPHDLKPISMASCMDCHRKRGISNDCTRCHK